MSPPEPSGASTSWLARIGKVVLRQRLSLALALGTSIVGMLVGVVVPLVERQIIDQVMVARHGSAIPYVMVIIVLALGSFGFSFLRRFFGGRLAFDVQHDLRNRIFRHLQRLDFARHDELQTGQLVSRANSDVGLVQGLLSFLPLMVGNVIMALVSLVVMYVISPPLAVVETAAIPVLAAVAIGLRSRVFPSSYDAQQKEGEVATTVEEAITGVRVVKGFGREDAEVAKLARGALALFQARVRLVKVQSALQSTLTAVPGIIQGFILLVGSYLALHGHLTIGTFLVFFSYLVQIQAPIRQLSVLISFSQQARAGAERIFELLDANPLVVDPPNGLDEISPGPIVFEDVTFGYQRGQNVLDGLNLVLSPGTTTAVIGLSGSGKSTLALLLPRFYDATSGCITIGGIDIRDVKLGALRRRIGVVFEESFLFSESIAANIAYGFPEASQDRIHQAATQAGALEFIEDLPHGFDTVVGESGITLSGGQRQRIALARALITDPEILILDDATSAVDSITESVINDSLRAFSEHRTVIVIAHRRSTLSLAERIVVLDQGKVAAIGSHEELLEGNRIYQRLVSTTSDALLEEPQSTEESLKPTVALTAVAPRVAMESNARLRNVTRGSGSLNGPGGAPLTATEELLRAMEKLPPETRDPRVDEAAVTGPARDFSFWSFIKPFKRGLVAGLLLLTADTLASLAGPALIRSGIDSGVVAKSFSAIEFAALGYFAVTLVDWAVVFAQSRVTGITSERILYALRLRIFSHLQHLGLDYYESEMSGRIMTRMTTDVDALSNLLQTGLSNAVVNVLSFLGVAIVMVVINAQLALAALWVMIPLALATYWFQRNSQRAYRLARERIAAVNANLAEGLSGVRVTQAFRREGRNSAEFEELSKGYRDSRVKAQRLVAIYFPFVLFLSDVASASVLGFGSGLVGRNQLTVGAAIAFTLYIDQLFSPIQQLSQTFDQYQQAQVAVMQVGRLMRIQPNTPLAAHPRRVDKVSGHIEFREVSFSYSDESNLALDGFNIDIAAGESVALVGATGAGKSTVVKMIARFYDPSRGAVLVDGIDLREMEMASLRSKIGFVPQEPFLFSGTVAENIAFAADGISMAAIEAAAAAVGADEFISKLEGAYNYQVSERGRALSLGQKQLIALARAYVASPAILLLDEATANLDLATERRVSEAMRVLTGGRTSVLVAHRLPSAAMADRIIVVAHGKAVESGSHSQLLRSGGIYAEMWESFSEASSVA